MLLLRVAIGAGARYALAAALAEAVHTVAQGVDEMNLALWGSGNDQVRFVKPPGATLLVSGRPAGLGRGFSDPAWQVVFPLFGPPEKGETPQEYVRRVGGVRQGPHELGRNVRDLLPG
jgi:hypothetical protein